MYESVGEILRKAENNFINGTTQIGDYVTFEFHKTIQKILAYLNSQFVGGDTDSLGREKPFFNIVTAAVNIWYRATDIDRKDITVLPGNQGDVAAAFLATVLLQDWMKRARFGTYLNKWGITLAKHGSAVSKFVVQKGELKSDVIPWTRLIVDSQDFYAGPVIEKINLTPAQLRKRKDFDQDVVEGLITSVATRKSISRQTTDNLSDFIELYEVHGEFSQEVYKRSKGKEIKEGDKDIYFQQIHIVSYVSKGRGRSKEYDDFTLYSGKEINPYEIDHLIEEDGRTLSIGAVEHLFQAQWMVNHSVKNIKDTLDIASLLLFQTADKRFLNRNVFTSMITGDILLNGGSELTQVNTGKPDITALQNFMNTWKILGNEITGVSESMMGQNPPSGTAWRQTEALLQESHSLFEIMLENKALALENKLRDRIIPYLKTKLDTKEEIMSVLQDHQIQQIDAIYIPKAAIKMFNKRSIDMILNEEIPPQFNQEEEEQGIKQGLSSMGNMRSFKPTVIKDGKEVDVNWKEVVKDLEWKLDTNISGEQKNKAATLTSLATTFQTIVSLAGRPLSPDERLVFNKIMSESGTVSPIELSTLAGIKSPVEITGMPAAGRVPV